MSLLEGLISSLVLLTGLVGVLQGIMVASRQNSMAARHTRASLIAQETLSSLRTVGYARLTAPSGVLGNPAWCLATPSTAFQKYTAGLHVVPAGLGTYTACTVDLDTVASGNAAVRALTSAYASTAATGEDDDLFTRAVIFYKNTSSAPDLHYVTVVVSWRELTQVRTVTQTAALYDPGQNQTNVEL
ncbi:MAG: type IV pilus modification PilV family protein [Myxococcota bacterium]